MGHVQGTGTNQPVLSSLCLGALMLDFLRLVRTHHDLKALGMLCLLSCQPHLLVKYMSVSHRNFQNLKRT